MSLPLTEPERERLQESWRVDERGAEAQLRLAARSGQVEDVLLAIAIAVKDREDWLALPPGYRVGWVSEDGTVDESAVVALQKWGDKYEWIECRRTEGFVAREAEPDYYLAPGEHLSDAWREQLAARKRTR